MTPIYYICLVTLIDMVRFVGSVNEYPMNRQMSPLVGIVAALSVPARWPTNTGLTTTIGGPGQNNAPHFHTQDVTTSEAAAQLQMGADPCCREPALVGFRRVESVPGNSERHGLGDEELA